MSRVLGVTFVQDARRVSKAPLAGAIAVVLLLTGCAALGGASAPALDTVTLPALAPDVTASGRAGKQILVAEPKALKILDSQSIVVATSPTSLEYLGGVQWADRLPSLVQTKIAESLQNAGVSGGVGLPGQGLAIDYQLITEIRDFSVAVSAGNTATVTIFAKLLNDRNGEVVASRLFSASSTASTGRFPEGLNRAFEAAVTEMVAWTAAAF